MSSKKQAIILVIALVGSLALFFALGRGGGDASPEPAAALETPTTDHAEELHVPLAVVDSVSEAMRIYASFPDPRGADAALQELRDLDLLTEPALEAITSEWTGPIDPSVRFRATRLEWVMEHGTDLPNRTVLQAVVTQEASFPETGTATYYPRLVAELELHEAGWRVVRLHTLSY